MSIDNLHSEKPTHIEQKSSSQWAELGGQIWHALAAYDGQGQKSTQITPAMAFDASMTAHLPVLNFVGHEIAHAALQFHARELHAPGNGVETPIHRSGT